MAAVENDRAVAIPTAHFARLGVLEVIIGTIVLLELAANAMWNESQTMTRLHRIKSKGTVIFSDR